MVGANTNITTLTVYTSEASWPSFFSMNSIRLTIQNVITENIYVSLSCPNLVMQIVPTRILAE